MDGTSKIFPGEDRPKSVLVVALSPFFGSPLPEVLLHLLFSFVTTAMIWIKAVAVSPVSVYF